MLAHPVKRRRLDDTGGTGDERPITDLFPHSWTGKAAESKWKEAEMEQLGSTVAPRTTVPRGLFDRLQALVVEWKAEAAEAEREGRPYPNTAGAGGGMGGVGWPSARTRAENARSTLHTAA